MTRYNLAQIAGELDPVEFEFPDGRVFTAVGDPTQAVWDSLEAFARLSDKAGPNEAIEAVRGLLVAAFGEEQTAALMESCGMIALAALAGQLSEHYTEKAGKVQGSNRASRRSTVPSKRTSNASTGSISNGRVGVKTRSGAPG